MKQMFSAVALLAVLALAAIPAQAQFSIGGEANYSTGSESVGGNVEAMYQVRLASIAYLAPNARYSVNEYETSRFSANADLRFIFKGGSDLRPYAGVGYGYDRFSPTLFAFDEDGSERSGVNVHAGASYGDGDGVQPYVQVRYHLNDAIDNLDVQAGVRYRFRN